MTESARALFERWIDAINRMDLDAMAAMLHPDYVDEMPQTGERIRGVSNLIASVANYPDADKLRGGVEGAELVGDEDRWAITPNFTVVQVVGDTDLRTVTARVRYPDGSRWYMIVLARMKDGLILRTTSYYAPELPAPEWRAPWVEPMGAPDG